MKNLIMVALLFSFYGVYSSYSQNAFYDAQLLSSFNKSQIEIINNSYKIEIDKLDAQDKVQWLRLVDFINDPWNENLKSFDTRIIYKVLNLDTNKKYLLFDLKSSSGNMFNKLAATGGIITDVFSPNFGADFIGKTIDATASLLLERTKAELALAYFSKIKEEFESKRYLTNTLDSFQLKDIFPSIFSLVENSETEILSPNVGNSFKRAIQSDLSIFPENADSYLLPVSVKEKNEYKFFKLVYFIMKDLKSEKNPADIISSLALKYPKENTHFNSLINILYSISESLKDTSGDAIWVNVKSFEKFNRQQVEYYLALLHLSNPESFDNMGITINELKKGDKIFIKSKQIVKECLGYMSSVQTILKDVKNSSSEYGSDNKSDAVSLTAKFKNYSKIFLDLFGTVANFKNFSEDDNKEFQKFSNNIKKISDHVINIELSVENKEYATVVFETFKLINIVYPDFKKTEGLVKYITVACDISAAQTEDQIKAILDAAILPVGSYKIKRNVSSSLSINSYVGINTGFEHIKVEGVNSTMNNYHFSPFAPIGINYSGGCGGWSHSLFISIIDLGALVSYNFMNPVTTNDTSNLSTQSVPNVTLLQVFSPGLFYIVGIKDSPISFGIGAQMTPELRKIDQLTTKGTEPGKELTRLGTSFRISFLFSVDIPLFSLYTGKPNSP